MLSRLTLQQKYNMPCWKDWKLQYSPTTTSYENNKPSPHVIARPHIAESVILHSCLPWPNYCRAQTSTDHSRLTAVAQITEGEPRHLSLCQDRSKGVGLQTNTTPMAQICRTTAQLSLSLSPVPLPLMSIILMSSSCTKQPTRKGTQRLQKIGTRQQNSGSATSSNKGNAKNGERNARSCCPCWHC